MAHATQNFLGRVSQSGQNPTCLTVFSGQLLTAGRPWGLWGPATATPARDPDTSCLSFDCRELTASFPPFLGTLLLIPCHLSASPKTWVGLIKSSFFYKSFHVPYGLQNTTHQAHLLNLPTHGAHPTENTLPPLNSSKPMLPHICSSPSLQPSVPSFLAKTHSFKRKD